jgi:hypothetical protein
MCCQNVDLTVYVITKCVDNPADLPASSCVCAAACKRQRNQQHVGLVRASTGAREDHQGGKQKRQPRAQGKLHKPATHQQDQPTHSEEHHESPDGYVLGSRPKATRTAHATNT